LKYETSYGFVSYIFFQLLATMLHFTAVAACHIISVPDITCCIFIIKPKRAGTEKATTKLVYFFNGLCLFTENIKVAAIIMIIINSTIIKMKDLATSFIMDLYPIFISLNIYTYSF